MRKPESEDSKIFTFTLTSLLESGDIVLDIKYSNYIFLICANGAEARRALWSLCCGAMRIEENVFDW